MEIILVDDGSTDSSGSICAKLASDHPSIVFTTQPNMGLSGARNTGLHLAQGDYVVFVDADDWCEPDMASALVQTAINEQADVVVAGAIIDHLDSNGKVRERIRCPPTIVDSATSELSPEATSLIGYAWNKLYRRELLEEEGIRFENGLDLVEDIVFNSEAFTKAYKIAWDSDAYVHYVQRPGASLGRQTRPNYLQLRLRALDSLEICLRQCGASEVLISTVLARQATYSLRIAARLVGTPTSTSDRRRYWFERREAIAMSAIAEGDQESTVLDRLLAQTIRHLGAWSAKAQSGVRGASSKEGRIRRRSLALRRMWRFDLDAVCGAGLRKLVLRAKIRLAYMRSSPDCTYAKREAGERLVFFLLAADYGNVGDLAISHAQERFLNQQLPERRVVSIPISQTLPALKCLRRAVEPGDLVALVGGGNTGDMYDDIQYLRELCISALKHTPMVSFPQTIDFSDGTLGAASRLRAARIYNSHDHLAIMARDSQSLESARAIFSNCSSVLAPDVVLSLSRWESPAKRSGTIVALRSDQEAAELNRFPWKDRHPEYFPSPVLLRDTHIHRNRLSTRERDAVLGEFLKHWNSAELVVTDRLHGMILSVLTGTPCIALDSATHKVANFYDDWLRSVPYVIMVHENTNEALESGVSLALDSVSVGQSPDAGAILADAFSACLRAVEVE